MASDAATSDRTGSSEGFAVAATGNGLREGGQVAVLGLELDELREEGERLVGGAHGDGASDGAHDGEEPEEDVGDGRGAADARRHRPHQGRLGALPVLDHHVLRHRLGLIKSYWRS